MSVSLRCLLMPSKLPRVDFKTTQPVSLGQPFQPDPETRGKHLSGHFLVMQKQTTRAYLY